MLVKKPLPRRLSVYREKLNSTAAFLRPAGARISQRASEYGRRAFGSSARFGKRMFRQSKGGVVSFFTNPRGYANHILFVFLMLFMVAFFGPALYDFSIIAVMGFLGVLKMLLQFFLILFEFPLNTATEMISGMLNSLAGVFGWSVGTWCFDINGDGVYTSLYNLSHNIILEVPNLHLSTNPWDYTIMSYLTNWGSSALPGVSSTASTGSVHSFSGHAALVSDRTHDFIGHSPGKGWLNSFASMKGLLGKIPFA